MMLEGEVDNPDQRITQDVTTLCTNFSLILSKGMVSPGLIIWYSYVLFKTFGWVAPVTCYVYFVFGAICNSLLGHRVVASVYRQERLEGDFRFNHVWLRTHREAVALHDGHVAEQLRLTKNYEMVANNSAEVSYKRLPLYLSMQLFDYLGSIVNYAALGFVILQWKASGRTEAEISEVVGSGSYSCLYLISAFSTILDLAQTCSDTMALSSRVAELFRSLKAVEEASGIPGDELEESDDERDEASPLIRHSMVSEEELVEMAFSAKSAEIMTPQGDVLVRDLNMRIGNGMHLLVTGRSGVGKSSLVRAFAGLWPTASGCLKAPASDVVCYLPQTPYLFRGSLEEQLTYPAKFLRHLPAHKPPQSGVRLKDELHDLLVQVGLSHLPERVGGWDVSVDWPTMLSLGEQQRIALARLLRSRPVFAILDEATSAIELSAEEGIYEALKEARITLVSVGHRESLEQYHNHRLELLGGGSWSLEELP